MSQYEIQVKVLENGKLPCKAHKTDAGFDLYATEDIVLKYGEITKHPLNIVLALPESTYAEIATKSGLGLKGMLVYAGIIDQEYRGVVHVICSCIKKDTEIVILKGQKIAQMIIHPFSNQYFVTQVDELDENTSRSTGGFGSSGV